MCPRCILWCPLVAPSIHPRYPPFSIQDPLWLKCLGFGAGDPGPQPDHEHSLHRWLYHRSRGLESINLCAGRATELQVLVEVVPRISCAMGSHMSETAECWPSQSLGMSSLATKGGCHSQESDSRALANILHLLCPPRNSGGACLGCILVHSGTGLKCCPRLSPHVAQTT